MKVTASALVVLASSGTALGSWVDWFPFQKDVTVTATSTRTVQVCPCNGEVRITQPHPAGGKPTGTVDHYTVTEIIDPHWAKPRQTITKAGPIVVVFTTAGSITTKTGVLIELQPTKGPIITKTIWTGPQPTDDLAWIDWVDSDDNNGGTLTRSHTKTETVYGPAPTDPQHEPWADWVATSNTKKATSTTKKTTTKSATGKSTSTSAASTSSRSGGPTGGSTWSWGSTSSSSTSSTSSTSSSSVSIGPIDYSTTSTWSSSTSTSTSTSISTSTSTSVSTTSSSSSFSINPIDVTTSSSSSSSSTSTLSTTSTSADTTSTISSTSSVSINPIDQTTSSSSTSSAAGVQTTSATTTSPAVISSTSSSTAAATTTSAGGTGSVVIDDVRNLDYITAILQQHNVHRRNHSAVDLTWSPSLAATANTIASSCIYAHNIAVDGGGYGQNIGAGYTPNQVGVMITNDMYNGEFSNFPGPYDTDNIDLSNFNNFGHFTQIVWKGTTQVGCATVTCPGGLVNAGFTPYFTVCNYSPPGNIRGAYSNVGAPLGGPIHVVLAN